MWARAHKSEIQHYYPEACEPSLIMITPCSTSVGPWALVMMMIMVIMVNMMMIMNLM